MNKVVPQGWVVKSIGELVKLHYGKSPKNIIINDGLYPVIGTGGITGYASSYLYDGCTTVIGRKGTINKPLYVEGKFWAIDTTYFGTCYKNAEPKWFYYSLNSFDLSKYNEASGVPSLGRDTLNAIPILVPPLIEQQKIATILSSVDHVIEKTRAQIDKLKDLKTGMMQELLTKGIGHTKFKDSAIGIIPASWEVLDLQAICTSKYAIVDGPFGSNLKTEHYKTSGIPVFQSGLVTSNKFVKRDYVYVNEEKYQEQFRSSAGPGDILMAKIGMRAGACAIIPEGHQIGILAGNSLKITVDSDKAKNSFILSILHFLQDTGQIRRLLTETAQPAVSITTLKKMLIPLPPMSEQHAIGDLLTSLDRKLESATKKYNSYKLLKKALMQDLLTGKVRVKLDKESTINVY